MNRPKERHVHESIHRTSGPLHVREETPFYTGRLITTAEIPEVLT